MKGFLCGLSLVCVFAFAAALCSAADDADRFPGRRISLGVEGTGNFICAFGDSIFGYDVQTGSGDNQCLGVEFDGTNFFVTGGNSGSDPNKVYLFDASGNYVSSFDQFRSSVWGWRDLAYDGNHLYGSDDGNITEFDASGTDYGDFSGAPVTVNRALAYDPATDHFYTANWASDIYEIDRTGTVIGNWTNTYSVYGMAWDDVSSDGPWLWVFEQPPGAMIRQWDPVNHVYTGLSLDVQIGSSIAGGAAFTTDWDPSLGILVCLHQGTPDAILGYEITPAAARDVSPLTIDSPGALVAPGVPVTPCATVQNTGDSTETFYTLFLIDSAGVNVYTDSSQVNTLMPDSLIQVCFPDWTPDGQGNVYDLTCITNLPADEAQANDTLRGVTMAFTVDSLIACGWAATPPTVDGTIDPAEWTNATVVDISDILGMGSAGVNPNSVIMYVMNNASHLFFAVDYLVDNTDNVNDRTTVYIDENNDDGWAPDSSEGNYWAFKSSTGPKFMYRPLPVGPFTDPIPGAEIGMGFVTHVTFEFSIPIGMQKYEIDAALGDTLGMHIYAHDQGIDEDEGWWLQTLDAANQDIPGYYGHIVLSMAPGVHEKGWVRAATSSGLLGAYPNPFSGATRVSFVTESRRRVSLEVYDLAGRVVRELLNGVADPGRHDVAWDGKDSSGKDLPSGVYFYSLSSGGRGSSMKTVLLK
ncbi:MAG: FlgD immunoglobulin-like domain containing protein [bacterium]